METTGQPAPAPPSLPSAAAPDYRAPFAVMTLLFFMWGFITSINDILIPRFKEAFGLNLFQAMLVQSAFFGAYFIGSLVYFCISATRGDPLGRIGYKNGVVIGLLVASAGMALVWVGATLEFYPVILGALFVIGLGVTLLQIAANPYVTILGPEKTAPSRLNLAQAFNSMGTTFGPLIGGFLIFNYFARDGADTIDSVKVPYLAFCAAFLVIAIVYYSLKLPKIGAESVERGAGALKHPGVLLGVLAIFMYVGGEVSIGSSLINFLGHPEIAAMDSAEASQYVALFWGGMLIGRFMGATALSEMSRLRKQMLMAIIPLLGFGLFWTLRSWDGAARQFDFSTGWKIVRDYLPLLALCWVLFQFSKAAGRTLFIFGTTIVTLLAVAILTDGKLAMWCVVGIGLFTSIGWPNIFSLALEDMGAYRNQVSSLLVMAILGGAVLPPLQGTIADHFGIGASYLIPMIAYAYVAFYGLYGCKIGKT